MDDGGMTEGTASAQPALGRRRVWVRLGIALLWGIVMLAVFSAVVFGGASGGAYLGYDLLPRLDGGQNVGPLLALGFAVGIGLGGYVCHKARWWTQYVRLRRCDVRASATVVRCDRVYTPGARGPGNTMYTVYVTWRDYEGEHTGVRQYRFFAHGLRAFEILVDRNASLPVRYPSARPHRFIIDIPYAATMADQFI
jgi:hypothetical protein